MNKDKRTILVALTALLSMMALAGTSWSQEAFSASVNAALKTAGKANAEMKAAHAPTLPPVNETPAAPPYKLQQIEAVLNRCFSQTAGQMISETIRVKNNVALLSNDNIEEGPVDGTPGRLFFLSRGDMDGDVFDCASTIVGNLSIQADGAFLLKKDSYCRPAETESSDTFDLTSAAGALPVVAYDARARKATYDPRSGNWTPDDDSFSELLMIAPSAREPDPSKAPLLNRSTGQPAAITLDAAAYAACLNKLLQFKTVRANP